MGRIKKMSRAYCCCCLLPQTACLCAYVFPQPCPMPVMIYQHPLEAKHAKSTVPLLRLSLPDVRIEVAETFSPPPPLVEGDWWLLYPDGKAWDLDQANGNQSSSAQKNCLPAEKMQAKKPIGGLIVLDGTWRKTRLLLHLNPWLNRLPTLTFSQAPASAYAIRKGPGGQALSTLESVSHVLTTLHREFSSEPLYALLQARVAQFQAQRETAQQNGTPKC